MQYAQTSLKNSLPDPNESQYKNVFCLARSNEHSIKYRELFVSGNSN